MSDHSNLLEMSDEEAEFLDRVFNPQVHGEVSMARDEIDQSDLVITDNDQINSVAQASDKQSGKLNSD